MRNNFTNNLCVVLRSNHHHFRVILIFACLFAVNEALNAQQTISIQGTLKQSSGAPLEDGFYRVTFKLYATLVGGSPLWQETTDSLKVNGGIYRHALGSKTNLTNATFSYTVYLGIVLGGYETNPRTEITYAPYALAASGTICSGAVGDVQFSILSPTQFAQENGNCWVPLDGRDITGSKLASYVGSIPNAGGNFLRSQEFGGTYASGDIDPERTSTSAIATAQGDDNKSHNHTASTGSAGAHTHDFTDYDNRNCTGFVLVETGCDGVAETGSTTRTSTMASNGAHTHTVTVQNNGGDESRPKNLNLWIYIRIN